VTAQRARAGATSLADPADADRATLAAALDALPALDGEIPQKLTPMPGGLTNRNYRLTTSSGMTAVARFSSGKSSLLAIDRDAEFQNATIAADLGVGPRVLGYAPQQIVSVVEWIEGRTFESTDLDNAQTLARVAATCGRLHAGPRFVNDFDMFEIQRRYLAIVHRNGYRLPPRYVDFIPQVERMRAALRVRDAGTVPCHNDLLAANIMDDGRQIWFIDYEYAGNNDACFELGNIWSEADLSLDRLEELVEAYYGRPSRALVARARLLALMSKYGWTLWASIQDAVSDVDFDFWSWGMEKYERAVDEFDSPEFSRLITEVSQLN
jgi:thiamine kinase-like enzyme